MSWRRILLLTICLLACLVGATWYVLQRSGAATGIVRSLLADVLATEFELERAQVDLLSGKLTLDDFKVDDPQRPGSKLIQARTVQLDVETDPLGNVGAIHELVADGLVLDIDLTEGRAPNFAQLLRQQMPGSDANLAIVTPARVTRARARVRVDAEAPTLEFSEVELSLRQALLDDGTRDRRRGVISGSARFDNLGVAVDLLGDLDIDAGWCRLQAKLAELVVDAPFLRKLLPLLHTELAADVALGHMHHLTLHLDLPLSPTGDDVVVAGAAFEFSDVHCRLPELPVPLQGASVRGVVSTRDGGTGQFTGERLLPTGETEIVAKISNILEHPSLEVRGKGRDITIDDTVKAALRTFATGDAVLEALRPTAGSADFDLFLRDPGSSDEIADLDLQLHDVSLTYHGFGDAGSRVAFPLPITAANGRVHLRDNVVSIEDVTAQIAPDAGGGEVSMSGRVDPGSDGTASGKAERVSIDLFAPRLQCTPALRHAFGRLLRDDGAVYDQFAPQGAAAVRLRIRPDEVTGATTWQVDVDPLGATVTWERFPLPIVGVRGKVTARAEGMEFDLRAERPDSTTGATATLRGRLLAPPDRPGAITDGTMELRVDGSSVPLDAGLRRASTKLTPMLERVWDELQPSGAAGAELVIRRAHGDAPIVYDLRLDLAEASCLPRSFPMQVTHMQGQVFVHGRDDSAQVHVDTVRGLLQEVDGVGCELAVVGTIRAEEEYKEDLTVVLRELQLTEQFGALLEASGAAGPGTWDVLKPTGRVDVISRQEADADGEPRRRYTVLLRDAMSEAEMLPRPATNLSGELEIRDGELRFTDLRAKIGSATVICRDGRVGAADDAGRTEVAFVVSSERFQLDDTFARLFVGPLRQAVLERQLRGMLNVNGLSLRFLLPSDGTDEPIEVGLAGSIEALGVDMLLGTRLQNLNGVVTLNDSRVTRNGGRLTGHVTRGSLTFIGHPLLEIDSDFEADAERFILRGLELTLHGGRVQGRSKDGDSLVYELAPTPEEEGTLAADLAVRGMSLREFLVASGLTGTAYHGTVNGWVRLDRLYGYDFVDVEGQGSLEVNDGNLGNVPMFTAIYALMAEDARPRFESMSVQVAVKDRSISMGDLTLRSPLVTVNGGGTMSMEGYVNVVMTTDSLFGGSADILFIPWIIQEFTSGLMRVHFFGHLRDIQAEQRWFGQSDPHRRHLTPVPPRLNTPRRPDY